MPAAIVLAKKRWAWRHWRQASSFDVFLKDLATGAITRVSTGAGGAEGNDGSYGPVSFSPDGTKVAFTSSATNLVAGDTNGSFDVFIKDLITGAVTRISTNAAGVEGNDDSSQPVFSHAQGDRIDLSAIDANTTVVGDQAFSFIGTGPFTHQAGDLRLIVQGGNGIVAGDVDGNGAADFHIFLSAVTSLAAGDFLL
jgi:hypothetical protein